MAKYMFVTGKLAEQSLSACVGNIPDLAYEIAVLPISVAGLMDTDFIARHLPQPGGIDMVMIPGLCTGELEPIRQKAGVEVVRGPENLKDIPGLFGEKTSLQGYGEYRARIIAEIADAHQLTTEMILAKAFYYRASGADIIDLGCPPSRRFRNIGAAVTALKAAGFTVSVDSFNEEDILAADRAGVDFVLSVNSRNLELARELRSRVVVIPDFDHGMETLERNIERLESWRVRYIIDPVLKPIPFGFAQSIGDFIAIRKRHPDSEMMIGLGNITELTDADSTGINALMAAIAAELGIDYILTTEVISWTRGAVRELDIARRLMYYAHKNQILPKRLDDRLITVKDPPFEPFVEKELREMHSKTRDRHFRIFADGQCIYVFNRDLFVKGTDIQDIFDSLQIEDASHAFYLGRELQKALLAVKLGKRYMQEGELRWGYLS